MNGSLIRLALLLFTFFAATEFGFAQASHQSGDEVRLQGNVLKGALYPNISSDGKTIVFSYQGAIWRVARKGGAMVRLTSKPGFDIYPVQSPDGKWIAFIRTNNNIGGRLVIIRSTDGEERKLAKQIAIQGNMFFDQNGDRLLGRFNPGDGSDLSLRWLHLEDIRVGTGLIKNSEFVSFALSKDSKRIFVSKSKDVRGAEQSGNNGPQNTVLQMRSEGGPLQPLFSFPARIYRMESWPNGKGLCVVSDLGGAHYNLWNVAFDEPQKARKLTFGLADEDFPSISADGRWLLYSDNRRGPTSLKIKNLDSSTNGEDSSEEVKVTEQQYGKAVVDLTLRIVDTDDDQPIPARIIVEQDGGKSFAPPGAMYGMLRRSKMHFSSNGIAKLTVPIGSYTVTVFRGPEYRPSQVSFNAESGRSYEKTIQLKRWIDQRKRKWFSGEAHIHANYGYGYWYNSPESMYTICSAEDLQVCNLMVANSDGDGVFDREYFRGRIDPFSTSETVLYWNEEFRSTIWGHMTLLNLKRLVEPVFTGFKETTNPHDHITNADIGAQTHDQHGHVNYTHPAQNVKDPYLSAYSAKALPIDVALGTVDSIDVMGSNHHANMSIWYRLLNCGFKIPASAGTDCFSNRIPARLPGEVRAYVKINKEFSYSRWIKGLKDGKSFVTNGPMLDFSVGGKNLGETLSLLDGDKVNISAKASSQYEFTLLEIIFNGEVLETVKPELAKSKKSNEYNIAVNKDFVLPSSGWVAFRVYGKSGPHSTISQFAHSSPIYVDIQSRPMDPSKDAKYFVDWIDRLWNDVQKRDRILKHKHEHVESQILEARKIFTTLFLKQKAK